MNRRPLTCTAFLSIWAVASAPAQVDPDTVQRIREEGFESSQVIRILDDMTNGIGHRLTGSDNFTLACRWAKSEFERFGVPKVELEKWGTWPVVWNRGQWMGRVVSPEPIELQVATDAWTNGTHGVLRSHVVATPRDAESLEAVRDSLPGAFLFGSLPSRRSPFRRDLDAACEEAGLAGYLYSSRGDDQFPTRMRVFGDSPRSSRIPDDPPRIMIRRDQFRNVSRLLKNGEDVVAEFDIRNRWRDESIDLHNVIAEIPGTELPDECVVVCGHLDSWHQATGTTDNGTGAATTLEAARILMAVGAKPRRTIRFCLWGGEEQGLLGSDRHVKMRRTQMGRVSAVFNHDTGTNWAQGLAVTQPQAGVLEPVIAPLLDLPCPDEDFEGDVFRLRIVESLGTRGGSDHASFLAAGVPGFAWGLRGRSNYFRHTWHTQWDTFDAAIPEYLRHTSTVIALVALGTANLPERLPRKGVDPASGDDLEPQVEGILGCELGGENSLSIESVRADGRAERMGLQAGDRIVGVGEDAVDGLMALRRGLRRRSGGEAGDATLVVMREGQRVELPLRPVEAR